MDEVPVSAVRTITEAQRAASMPRNNARRRCQRRGGLDHRRNRRQHDPHRGHGSSADGWNWGDRRKTRQVRWQEARLSLAHAHSSVTPRFAATLGARGGRGALRDCALRVGLGLTSRVHSVGDGAPWIADQVHQVFGQQGGIWWISTISVSIWPPPLRGVLRKRLPSGSLRQTCLKQSEVGEVLAALAPYLEAPEVTDKAAPVRCCSRYLTNRPGQFDYQRALAADLPIGSGEIESAHRYVIQQRLKLAGAWWKEATAADMLALRTLRANGEWNQYWTPLEQLAA